MPAYLNPRRVITRIVPFEPNAVPLGRNRPFAKVVAQLLNRMQRLPQNLTSSAIPDLHYSTSCILSRSEQTRHSRATPYLEQTQQFSVAGAKPSQRCPHAIA